MNNKEWKAIREGLTEKEIRNLYENAHKIVCSYCGCEMSDTQKTEMTNHILTCEKRPEPKLLAKAFEIEDRLYGWLKHVAGISTDGESNYSPTKCETCAEIKKAIDLYDSVEVE